MAVHVSMLERCQSVKDDFAQVRGFTFNDVYDVRLIPDDDLSEWNDKIGLKPAALSEIFNANVQKPDMPVKVFLREGRFSLRAETRSHPRLHFYTSAFLNDTPYIKDVQISAGDMGFGSGKRSLRSLAELYAALGFDGISFIAGKENGGYTWPKAGLHLDMAAMTAHQTDELRVRMQGRLFALKEFIPDHFFHCLFDFAGLNDKYAVVRIANFQAVIPPVPKDKILSSLQFFYEGVSMPHGLNLNREAQAITGAMQYSAARGDHFTPVGMAILCGLNEFPVRADFSDLLQMQRIGAYVGKWKTISPQYQPMAKTA